MDFIRMDKQNRVAVLTICNEKALGAITIAMLNEINEALDMIDDAGALVITGASEKAFAAGADIGEMKDLTPEQAYDYSLFGNSVFRRIETLPIPVIAAVNGYALGGGMELAMCADFRVAADTAVFGQPEVSLGITPGFGGTQRLARIVGLSAAKYLLFSCKRIDADKAFELGLVDIVTRRDELMDTVMELAEKISEMPQSALRSVKKAVSEGFSMDMDEAIRLEAGMYEECYKTSDPNRLMTAFLDKRKK